MKPQKMLTIVATSLSLFSLFAISGCGKKALETPASGTSKVEIPGTNTGKIKSIKLGQASEFSILAYASISSVPSSSIGGKIGLMPGVRELIRVDPSEMAGGAADIIGSEDETVPMNLLSNAKVDMVTTYSMAARLGGDKDKIDLHNGDVGGKTLSPGIYEWNNTMTISKDFTIEGTENDIWIFKVQGHLNVAEGVRMILASGVNPDNILWQVAGSVVLGANSHFAGTIISQPSIELKEHSELIGRAFAKNGFVNLNQATIKKP